jgi:putative nucleotidyltransferase with HDIG domain
VAFEEEFEAAKALQKEATKMVSQLLTHVKLGKPVDFDAAEATADNIITSLQNNQSALLVVSHIRSKDRYLLEHSFNVSVLMGVLASSLGYADEALHTLVSGALLHDIGKIRVDDSVLHKPGSLEPEEWEEMKRHVTYGEEELAKIGGIDPVIIDICAQHHERLDGSGYPRGLHERDIPMHSRMASVVDVYDAITADRCYHEGMNPAKALKCMLEWSSEKHLDKQLVYQFIRCLSVYPAGSIVKLNNNRLAAVETVHPTMMDKPKVQVIYSLDKKSVLSPYPLDLAKPGNEIAIEKAVDPSTLGLSAAKMLETL